MRYRAALRLTLLRLRLAFCEYDVQERLALVSYKSMQMQRCRE